MSKKENESKKPLIKPHSQPIYQASVYDYPDLASIDAYYEGKLPEAYLYGRYGLPNAVEFASSMAMLEKHEAGLACSSGMGAIFAALLTGSRNGENMLASRDLYGETYSLLKDILPRFGTNTIFADSGDVSAFREEICERNPSLVFLETISNPKLRVCDIKRISETAHDCGSIVIVDNTMATPFVLIPAELGADVTIHSGTKSLGGHHDLTIGVIAGRTDFVNRATELSRLTGSYAGPLDSWLAQRSFSTWKLRVEKSSENALKLAEFLEGMNKVSRVYYPGLMTHPDHELSSRIFKNGNYGGVLSFDLKGDAGTVDRFIKAFPSITLTPSFGGVSTTISHPGKTSHRTLDEKERKSIGISDSMLRVSVGVEDYHLIEEEFRTACNRM